MIRVFIADDHVIVRRGLRQIVAETPEIVIAGEAGTGQEALRGILSKDYDVVLLDITMPDLNGLDVLKELKRQRPEVRVLMLSIYPEEQFAIRALKAGALGYLTKDSAPAELVEAIKKVKGVIAPFPGGIVRSGSKIGSQYDFLDVSTNTAYCPTLKSTVGNKLPEEVNSVLEIVLDGLDADGVYEAMREGITAACTVEGIINITAGNYGGKLGKHLINLHEVVAE